MLLTAALGVLGVASGALAARMAELQIVLIPVSIASLPRVLLRVPSGRWGAPAARHALDRYAGLTGAVGCALDAPLRVPLLAWTLRRHPLIRRSRALPWPAA